MDILWLPINTKKALIGIEIKHFKYVDNVLHEEKPLSIKDIDLTVKIKNNNEVKIFDIMQEIEIDIQTHTSSQFIGMNPISKYIEYVMIYENGYDKLNSYINKSSQKETPQKFSYIIINFCVKSFSF
jgi:hypothetical protein